MQHETGKLVLEADYPFQGLNPHSRQGRRTEAMGVVQYIK
jgi:hypothetical protein